jgi:Fe2+ or Zn2+ uptake regulation protein
MSEYAKPGGLDVENKHKIENTRSTRQRQAVLDAFADEQVHLAADEVYQLVKSTQPNISLGTVYRNLDLLTRQGMLNRFILADGTRKYERASSHHHHLVCMDCGNTQNIPGCPMNSKIQGYSNENQFQVVRHSFEVYGYCSECSRK